MFPEGKTFSGKRLVPQMAVGCVVFALVGLLGTFFVANVLKPYFQRDRAELVREAEAREAGRKR